MKISYALYLFVLIFAPLAFGTVELWSLSTVEIVVAASATLYFSYIFFYKKHVLTVPGLLPLLLLLLFMLLQLIPLPAAVIKFVSPATYDAYLPVVSLQAQSWIPLSLNPKATSQEFLRISCYGLFYLLTIQLMNRGENLKRTVSYVAMLAAAIAFLAIVQNVGSPDKIYWIRNVPENASPFGPWINPNQFAGFMEMMSPIALSLFLFYRPRVSHGESLRTRVAAFFTMPSTNIYLFLGFASCLMALSVFVSLCRGGIITISLSLIVYMLLYNLKKPQYGRTAIAVIAVCVVVGVSWLGWDTVVAEFNRGITPAGTLSDARFIIWQDSLKIFQSYPLFGTGFGTFVDIFPSYMSFGNFPIIDHAHNDYVELLTDGGAIGFALASWFAASVIGHGWRGIKSRGDKFAVLLGIGALTGIIAMLMHSVTDFNMHNGADGLYFFFLCGLLVAVVNIRYEYYKTTTLLSKKRIPVNKVYAGVVIILTVVTVVVQSGVLRAQYLYNKLSNIYISTHLSTALQQTVADGLIAATQLDPLEYFYHYRLGSINSLFGNPEEARKHFVQAVRRNPMNGTALQDLGALLSDGEQVQFFMELGYERGLERESNALTFITYLLQNNDRDKAAKVMAERLAKDSGLMDMWADLFREYNFSRSEIKSVLGNSTENFLNYGRILASDKNFFEADFYYSTALDSFAGDPETIPQWYSETIRFYKNGDQPERAILILRQAVERFPDYAPFHLQLGDYYLESGIRYRAQEEYERVLFLSPGDKAAQKRLRQMGLSDSYGGISDE